MPFYSVNGIKIDPTVFSRRIFSPQNRSDSVLNRFCGYGTKIPFTLFSLFASYQHCKFGNSAFFSGRARRGPQTIWRINRGIATITDSGQRIGNRRVTRTAGTQPGNAKFLPLLYCTTFFCFAEACCAGRRQFGVCTRSPSLSPIALKEKERIVRSSNPERNQEMQNFCPNLL